MKLGKRNFKVREAMSHFAKDWDGTGPKVKIRLPGSGFRGKKELLIAPGEVLATCDRRTQKALEYWAPPPIYVNGKPWMPRNKMFEETEDSEHMDFDEL